MNSNNIIYLENVNVNYGLYEALKNINIEINKGENWAILGANGSGKSTFVKLFTQDLYPLVKGEYKKILFQKERWDIFELKKNFGLVTGDIQNKFLYSAPDMTVEDVILSGYYASLGVFKIHNFEKNQYKRAEEIMDFLGIKNIKEKHVNALSTGELRRAIIGRAIIHEPKVFVLDEPTTGLDIRAKTQFIELTRKLSKKYTIILITHDISEVFPEITHVALIKGKTIFKKGLKKDVLTSENLSETFGTKLILKENSGNYVLSVAKL